MAEKIKRTYAFDRPLKVERTKKKKKGLPVAGKCSPGKKLVGKKCVVDPDYKKPKRGEQTYKKAFGKRSIIDNDTFQIMKDIAKGITGAGSKKKEVKKPLPGPTTSGKPLNRQHLRKMNEQLTKQLKIYKNDQRIKRALKKKKGLPLQSKKKK